MFDHYLPDPSLACPVCGTAISDWTGKDAACMLFTWKQGHKFPIKHDWPEESVEDEKAFLESATLPPVFAFYSYSCKCDREILVYGFCENDVWVRSEIATHLNFRSGPTTSLKDERKIKRDLEAWLHSKPS